jgi:hypothetical protein
VSGEGRAAASVPPGASDEELSFVDEHRQPTDAPAALVWAALLRVVGRTSRGGALFARLLGCEPARGTPAFEGRVGDAVTGFRVAAVEPGRRLELRGRHRFARYALTFLLDDGALRAVTHADFPGLRGRIYRALVLGSGGHRAITRAILRRIARAAR